MHNRQTIYIGPKAYTNVPKTLALHNRKLIFHVFLTETSTKKVNIFLLPTFHGYISEKPMRSMRTLLQIDQLHNYSPSSMKRAKISNCFIQVYVHVMRAMIITDGEQLSSRKTAMAFLNQKVQTLHGQLDS